MFGSYAMSNSERLTYFLVIVDYFSKWSEFVILGKDFTRVVAKAFFIILFLNMLYK